MSKAKKKQKAKPAPKKKPAPKPAKPSKKQAKAPAKKVPPPPSSVALVDARPPPRPPQPRRKDPGVPLKPPVVRVKHAIFGIGKLVRELPEGKIEVQFDNVGKKTLLASFVEVLPPVLG